MSPQITIQVLKEPRGLIRVLQFIFAIFAFSTTSGFSTVIKYIVQSCSNETIVTEIGYSFNLDEITVSNCPEVRLIGDVSSQAEYFVTVGVLTFLLCIGIIVVYVAFEHVYQENQLYPAADFIVSGVFVILWISAAAVWAQGVSDLKYFCNPNTFLNSMPSCSPLTCKTVFSGSFTSLNISLILGFSNFALWGASLWFIYKETHWFRIRQGNIA